ncbi:MAG TPA: hypothetical protein VGE52_19020, partial [Pirellulales bacterium]
LIIHYEARGRFPADDVMFDSLHSPHRSQLEELAINVDGVGRGPSRAILHALASSPYLRNLRTLNLSFIGAARGAAPIDADAIRELGASPNLARLEDLDLGDAALPSAVWNEILRWPCLPNLKRLRLAGAMLTNPPSHTLVDELAEFPELRRAFEQRVVQIEWDTETAGPWNKGTCWSGHSWVEMSRRHLLSMGRYTQRRDFAGLEAAFRQDCVYYAGEAVAQAIDALPIAEFESKVRNALYAMLPICDEFEPTVSVHFRVRPEQIGPPEFCFVCSRENVSFSDGGNDEHDGSGATLDDLTFAEAESLYERYLPVESFDSGGATHYLYARLVAAAARASAETKLSQTIHPLRLRLTCLHAVFPL